MRLNWTILPVALLTVLISTPTRAQSPSLPAFPGAEGFGALATGGRGGALVHVTTLADKGPGSFRDAVSKGPRIVVFDVAGYIDLASAVHVASDITIAGQTAPGLGVCAKNYEVSFDSSHNVIARYFRVRQGLTHRQDKKCALNLYKCHNIILDHVSIEWGRWDCIGFTDAKDVTVQYCLIGEGIDPQRFGCLCQSDNVTFSHNLWIDNQSRNPKAKGTVQYINNVIYNWGVTGYVGGHSSAPHDADLINNYFIKGPSSSNHFAGEFTATDHIFQSGNYVDLDRDGQLNGHLAQPADFPGATITTTRALSPPIPVTEDPAPTAYTKVLAGAGDSLHRDPIDTRLLDQLKSLGKSGAIIHDPREVGGFGEIPPAAPRAINITNPNQNLPSGYTKIEEYLNAMALPQ
jgi:hypothetical protein